MPGLITNFSPSGGRISIFRAAYEYKTLDVCSNILSVSFLRVSREKLYFSPAQKFWIIGVMELFPILELKGD